MNAPFHAPEIDIGKVRERLKTMAFFSTTKENILQIIENPNAGIVIERSSISGLNAEVANIVEFFANTCRELSILVVTNQNEKRGGRNFVARLTLQSKSKKVQQEVIAFQSLITEVPENGKLLTREEFCKVLGRGVTQFFKYKKNFLDYISNYNASILDENKKVVFECVPGGKYFIGTRKDYQTYSDEIGNRKVSGRAKEDLKMKQLERYLIDNRGKLITKENLERELQITSQYISVLARNLRKLMQEEGRQETIEAIKGKGLFYGTKEEIQEYLKNNRSSVLQEKLHNILRLIEKASEEGILISDVYTQLQIQENTLKGYLSLVNKMLRNESIEKGQIRIRGQRLVLETDLKKGKNAGEKLLSKLIIEREKVGGYIMLPKSELCRMVEIPERGSVFLFSSLRQSITHLENSLGQKMTFDYINREGLYFFGTESEFIEYKASRSVGIGSKEKIERLSKEDCLLQFFRENQGELLSFEQIQEHIETSSIGTVRSLVKRCRSFLIEKEGRGLMIKNIPGKGYMYGTDEQIVQISVHIYTKKAIQNTRGEKNDNLGIPSRDRGVFPRHNRPKLSNVRTPSYSESLEKMHGRFSVREIIPVEGYKVDESSYSINGKKLQPDQFFFLYLLILKGEISLQELRQYIDFAGLAEEYTNDNFVMGYFLSLKAGIEKILTGRTIQMQREEKVFTLHSRTSSTERKDTDTKGKPTTRKYVQILDFLIEKGGDGIGVEEVKEHFNIGLSTLKEYLGLINKELKAREIATRVQMQGGKIKIVPYGAKEQGNQQGGEEHSKKSLRENTGVLPILFSALLEFFRNSENRGRYFTLGDIAKSLGCSENALRRNHRVLSERLNANSNLSFDEEEYIVKSSTNRIICQKKGEPLRASPKGEKIKVPRKVGAVRRKQKPKKNLPPAISPAKAKFLADAEARKKGGMGVVSPSHQREASQSSISISTEITEISLSLLLKQLNTQSLEKKYSFLEDVSKYLRDNERALYYYILSKRGEKISFSEVLKEIGSNHLQGAFNYLILLISKINNNQKASIPPIFRLQVESNQREKFIWIEAEGGEKRVFKIEGYKFEYSFLPPYLTCNGKFMDGINEIHIKILDKLFSRKVGDTVRIAPKWSDHKKSLGEILRRYGIRIIKVTLKGTIRIDMDGKTEENRIGKSLGKGEVVTAGEKTGEGMESVEPGRDLRSELLKSEKYKKFQKGSAHINFEIFRETPISYSIDKGELKIQVNKKDVKLENHYAFVFLSFAHEYFKLSAGKRHEKNFSVEEASNLVGFSGNIKDFKAYFSKARYVINRALDMLGTGVRIRTIYERHKVGESDKEDKYSLTVS